MLCHMKELMLQSTSLVLPQEADNRFLECVQKVRADYLVTGNKRHYLAPAFESTAIVNLA